MSDKSQVEKLPSINEFARKYLERYQDKDVPGYLVEEGFAEECWGLGFEMDCGNSFKEAFPNNNPFESATELAKIINKVDDVWLLGNAIFSNWRYFTHWSMSSDDNLLTDKNRAWFIIAFMRMIELSRSCR